QQGGLRVDVHEHDLHRGLLRLVARHHLAHAFEDQFQPPGQVALRRLACLDGAAGHVMQTRPFGFDDAEAGGLQTGVDAENSHGAPRITGGARAMPQALCCWPVRYHSWPRSALAITGHRAWCEARNQSMCPMAFRPWLAGRTDRACLRAEGKVRSRSATVAGVAMSSSSACSTVM